MRRASFALVLALALTLAVPAVGQEQRGGGPRRGAAAVEALGARLPEVARAHGLSAKVLRERLQQDSSLYVDQTDRLFFVDPAAEGVAEAVGGEPTLTSGSFPTSETFALHSKAGSSRVIYLDFDGVGGSWGGTIGGAWSSGYTGGDGVAEPYDRDGAVGTFSQAEHEEIQSIWRRVAEDYAPFDVDVTTQFPGEAAITRSGSTDLQYGTRVAMTSSSTTCGCGGVAYVGVFDLTSNHAYYQPAFVYQEGAKSAAEAASHEAGHNLGLSHDGTATQGYYDGHGEWAPIMGVGYYEPVSQWSRGEYAGANNVEDDYSVMGSNGAAIRADDHGVGSAATALGSSLSATGNIERRTDIDEFSFNHGGGTVTVKVDPAVVSPNLDIAAKLLDSAGTILASSAPVSGPGATSDSATGLNATMSADLPSGTYRLAVDGEGARDPLTTGYSDYGSLGMYSVAVSAGGVVTPNTPPTVTASANPSSGTAPLTTTLSASGSDADGDALSYTWTFSEGGSATGQTVSRTYQAAGTYTATVTANDGNGGTAQSTVSISVTAAPTQTLAAPTTITATTGTKTPRISWNDPSSGETGFQLERTKKRSDGTYGGAVFITVAGGDTLSYTDAPSWGDYRYRVRATNGSATSAWSTAYADATVPKK